MPVLLAVGRVGYGSGFAGVRGTRLIQDSGPMSVKDTRFQGSSNEETNAAGQSRLVNQRTEKITGEEPLGDLEKLLITSDDWADKPDYGSQNFPQS